MAREVTSLGEIVLPLPALAEQQRLAELAEQTERAYGAAVRAAALRRAVFRDAIIQRLVRQAGRAAHPFHHPGDEDTDVDA